MTTANRVVPDRYGVINIGKLKENLVTEVSLPAPGFAGGSYAVLLRRPKEEQPYPVSARHDGSSLVWTVQTADTAIAGMGKLECRWYGDNGEVAKSQIYTVRITDGLPDPTEAPEAWAGFMQQVSRDAGRAESAAGRAEALEGGYTEALEKARAAAEDAWHGKVSAEAAAEEAKADAQRAETAQTKAQAAKTAAEEAAQEAKAAQTGAETAKTEAETAQGKAEEAAQGVAADREQIGANKSGLEAAQQELTATKEQLSETKAALTTTQEDLKKAKRAIQFQAELNKGQTWDFETDDQEAYQRTVPSGAKAGAVMAVGGKTVGWNQLCQNAELANLDGFIEAAYTVLTVADGIITANCKGPNPGVKSSDDNCIATINHYYYIATTAKIEAGTRYYAPYCNSAVFNVDPRANGTGDFVRSSIIAKAITSGPAKIGSRIATTDSGYYEGVLQMKQPVFIDLTLLFGPGNEPTDTSDPRIAQIEAYAAAHPEYNAGELVSALVAEVDVIGANILRPSGTFPVSSNGITAVRNQDSTITINGKSPGYPFFEVGRLQLKKGTTYFIPSKTRIMQLEDGNRIVVHDNNNGFTPDKDYPDVFLEYAISPNQTFSNTVIKPIVSVGALRDYSPYTLNTLPIPDAVKQLPGYGWSAGNVANTVERTEDGWQYVQRVEKTELTASISMDNQYGNYDNDTSFMICVDSFLPKISAYTKNVRSLSCNTLTCPPENVQDSQTKQVYALASHSNVKYSANLYIRLPYSIKFGLSKDSTSKEKVAASREWFAAHKTIAYYEQEPVTTDITALMGDSLAPFPVEAGGSITLHHPKADEGFAIEVPAKIQYITKLSEVSANG